MIDIIFLLTIFYFFLPVMTYEYFFIKAELQRQRDTNVSLKNTLSESEIDHKLRLQELETAKIR